jgi:hypothetical protein
MAYSGRVFTHQHNWTKAVKERLAWKTSVTVKRKGLEQRSKLRSQPRRSLEYLIEPMEASELRRLNNFLWASIHQPILVPIWTYPDQLTSHLSSGSDVLEIDTVAKDYDDNAYLLFSNAPDDYEAIAISSLTSSELTLAETTSKQWNKGTQVFPARLGRFEPRPGASVIGSDAKAYSVNFSIDETAYSTNRIASITPETYRSLDLFLNKPETSQETEHSFDRERRARDADNGLVSFDPIMPAPSTVFEHNELLLSQQELSDFLGFLDRRKGRLVPFWVPTWDRDFEPVLFNSTTFKFSECDYTSLVNAAEARRDVYVHLHAPSSALENKDFTVLRLSAPVDNGDGTEQATIASAHANGGGSNLNGAGVSAISLVAYLKQARLEADTVELSWDTDSIVDASLNFRELFRTA